MKSLIRKITTGCIAALALVMGAGQAMPALAAPATVHYVDDDPSNNGRTRCPAGATITSDLSTLAIAAGDKWFICPGQYTGTLSIFNLDNVTIIGKGNPVIRPAAGQYNIIYVVFSDNVRIQGLTLDGSGAYTVNAPTGISFSHSSGMITRNTIVRIRETAATTSCNGGAAIKVETATVRISKNTINEFQCYGLMIMRSPSAIIQGNKISSTATIGTDNTGIYGYDSASLVIGKNTITSDWTPSMITATFTGVLLSETPGAKVTGNRINNMLAGIWAQARCGADTVSPDRLVIQDNRLTAALMGVYIEVSAYSGVTCSPSSNGDIIRGNRFLYPAGGSFPVRVVTGDGDLGDGFAPSVTGLVLTGNRYSGAASLYSDNGGPGIGPVVERGTRLAR